MATAAALSRSEAGSAALAENLVRRLRRCHSTSTGSQPKPLNATPSLGRVYALPGRNASDEGRGGEYGVRGVWLVKGGPPDVQLPDKNFLPPWPHSSVS